MMKTRSGAYCYLAALLAAAAAVVVEPVAAGFAYRPFVKPGVIGYWPNWAPYSRPQNSIDKIDLTGVSIVKYAFLNLLANGTIESSDSFSDSKWIPITLNVRNSHPSLLTSISVGGWSLSRFFSDVAADAAATATFVKNIHAYMDTNGFDGVDIDFEFPGGGGLPCNSVRDTDLENMVGFFKALRDELGPARLISMAASVNAQRYVKNGINYLSMYAPYLSYIGVMAFDMYTSSSLVPYSDVHTALNVPGPQDPQRPANNLPNYSATTGVTQILSSGVPPEQLALGMAFYGHSWSVTAAGAQNGLFEACAKDGQTAGNATVCAVRPGDYLDATPSCDKCVPSVCAFTGAWMYFSLRGNNGTQRGAPLVAGPGVAGNGWTRGFAGWAATPTLYNPAFMPTDATGAAVAAAPYPVYISYDDPDSIALKTSWAKSIGLGGVFVWELSLDYQGEMLSAMKKAWCTLRQHQQLFHTNTSNNFPLSAPNEKAGTLPNVAKYHTPRSASNYGYEAG
ncbi:glycoside hydrolase superfamily [Zopfochytrium polystomum]|nr:glycoside hydrolase superfamily [Zopfochytrium polystomum]